MGGVWVVGVGMEGEGRLAEEGVASLRELRTWGEERGVVLASWLGGRGRVGCGGWGELGCCVASFI